MYEIEVTDEFPGAHFLKLYDGSCETRHDHIFKVAALYRAQKLDSMQVVADFEALKKVLKEILKEFSCTVNEHPDFRNEKLNPSVENMARLIFERLEKAFRAENARLSKVTVWETPDASASFFGN